MLWGSSLARAWVPAPGNGPESAARKKWRPSETNPNICGNWFSTKVPGRLSERMASSKWRGDSQVTAHRPVLTGCTPDARADAHKLRRRPGKPSCPRIQHQILGCDKQHKRAQGEREAGLDQNGTIEKMKTIHRRGDTVSSASGKSLAPTLQKFLQLNHKRWPRPNPAEELSGRVSAGAVRVLSGLRGDAQHPLSPGSANQAHGGTASHPRGWLRSSRASMRMVCVCVCAHVTRGPGCACAPRALDPRAQRGASQPDTRGRTKGRANGPWTHIREASSREEEGRTSRIPTVSLVGRPQLTVGFHWFG
ncbi:uncharacterized protein LOC119872933 [Canis lupus familiaris]|uniref:uncharacterized protein LOC119872933 n=1 Tax=Canis lupus familiaris TaxID=9615 RepID=UPI0018F7C0E3|nr:uncharacterized protein LOC119872933 [Canis lupus familiaris]XP_038530706.1 uncharacterized protein LOC119872933 [Canis lupus familiaris]